MIAPAGPPALVAPAPDARITVPTFRHSGVEVTFNWSEGEAMPCGDAARERIEVERARGGPGRVATAYATFAHGTRSTTAAVPFDAGPEQAMRWRVQRTCDDGSAAGTDWQPFVIAFEGSVPENRLIDLTTGSVAGVSAGQDAATAARQLGARRGRRGTYYRVLPRSEGAITLRTSGGRVTSIEVRGFGFATADGVHAGSVADDFQAREPGAGPVVDDDGVLRGVCIPAGGAAVLARAAVPLQSGPAEIAGWSVRVARSPGACV